MVCAICQEPVRAQARFCPLCGFPYLAPDTTAIGGPARPALTEPTVALVPLLAPMEAAATTELAAVRAQLVLRFAAETRLLVRLTERVLDTDGAAAAGIARLLSLERQLAAEWEAVGRTLDQLAAVEDRLSRPSATTRLERRRARLMLKLELDDARVAHWDGLRAPGHAAVDAALDRLLVNSERLSAELAAVRVQLAAAAPTARSSCS